MYFIKIILILLVSHVSLVNADEKSDFAVGLGVGTTGPTISATYQLNQHFNVRGIYAYYEFDTQETESGIN